ncbi:MAG: autoinducer synthase [Marinosulfonomonas sp.]|nr:autoinducer synthase [Marinosulfonomonas sp.]
MIIIVDSLNKDQHKGLLKDMHRLRARVFEGRLGWDVSVVDGQEIDKFDMLDPAHVISVDADGNVLGSMRLLQTTGPHMLADVFAPILDGQPPLRSSSVWEATRFCVDTAALGRGKGPNTISYVTSEVMIGAFEFGLQSGIKDAVAVIDPIMDRVLKRSGNAPYDYLGSPKPMGKVTALAALMDCSKERIASIRAYCGITHDVFASQAKEHTRTYDEVA